MFEILNTAIMEAVRVLQRKEADMRSKGDSNRADGFKRASERLMLVWDKGCQTNKGDVYDRKFLCKAFNDYMQDRNLDTLMQIPLIGNSTSKQIATSVNDIVYRYTENNVTLFQRYLDILIEEELRSANDGLSSNAALPDLDKMDSSKLIDFLKSAADVSFGFPPHIDFGTFVKEIAAHTEAFKDKHIKFRLYNGSVTVDCLA